jgi:glucosamine-6-phosphate deaminase
MREFHFLNGEGDPQAECRRVAENIVKHPIDVAFVGIGENGHLAFNDPPADFETDEPYLVVQLDEACRRQQLGEGWFPTFDDVPQKAISMSVRQIMKSAAIICTVPDERKAEAVRNTVEGEVSPNVPASILRRHKHCTLFLDTAGASQLEK